MAKGAPILTRIMKYLPDVTIGILVACLLFALVGLALAMVEGYRPLIFNTIAFISLILPCFAFFLWLKSSRRSQLTRIQNGVAGAILAIAAWIPPLILTNVPEADWPIVLSLGGIAGVLVYLLLANMHRRLFHARLARNIALSAGIDDLDDPEVQRLAKNDTLPHAAVFCTGGPSLALTTVLFEWTLASSLSDVALVSIAWGISLTIGLIAYNFLPAQRDIYDFITESQIARKRP